MHKKRFGQSYCQDLLTSIPRKFILHFLIIILFSMNFRTSKGFPRFLLNGNEFTNCINRMNSAWAKSGLRPGIVGPANGRNGPVGPTPTTRRWPARRSIFTVSTTIVKGWCQATRGAAGLTEVVGHQ
jgi:hypothetical protein